MLLGWSGRRSHNGDTVNAPVRARTADFVVEVAVAGRALFFAGELDGVADLSDVLEGAVDYPQGLVTQVNAIYPYLTLLALYIADTGRRRNKSIWPLFTDLVLSVTTVMNPINNAVAALICLYIIFIEINEGG